MPLIQSIACALPEFSVTNDEVAERLRDGFTAQGEDPALVEQIFVNAGIDRRFLARPPGFYLQERGLSARNGAYGEVATALGVRAAQDALRAADVQLEQVDLVIDTSCTGVMIPALDVELANALGLRADVRRMPLTEAGCAAGATSLAFAHDWLVARPEGVVLLVSVELPSLTLQLDDASRANLVSAAIFGDGAAALVVSNREPLQRTVEHLAHESYLFPNTADVMRFDLGDQGFKIVLSQRIPLLVKRHLRERVDAFLERQGLDLRQLEFFALHPGGTKILDTMREVLELEEDDVAASRQTLRDFGNLSSASVHFVTRALLERGAVKPDALGLMVAMGPGFTVELALLRGRG